MCLAPTHTHTHGTTTQQGSRGQAHLAHITRISFGSDPSFQIKVQPFVVWDQVTDSCIFFILLRFVMLLGYLQKNLNVLMIDVKMQGKNASYALNLGLSVEFSCIVYYYSACQ